MNFFDSTAIRAYKENIKQFQEFFCYHQNGKYFTIESCWFVSSFQRTEY
jgi:hypothetical protein